MAGLVTCGCENRASLSTTAGASSRVDSARTQKGLVCHIRCFVFIVNGSISKDTAHFSGFELFDDAVLSVALFLAVKVFVRSIAVSCLIVVFL